MLHRILFLLCLLLLSALDNHAMAATPLKIMSFNVRTSVAQDPCPAGCWARRKFRVQKMLARYQPDLIGTQEGAPDQIEFFRTNTSYSGSIGECAGDCQWNERPSIFFNPSVWRILEGTTFALSDDSTPGSNTWNLQWARVAVLARFQHTAGQIVCMLNTHFDVDRGHDKSSMLVADRIAKFCQSGDTVIMTGDLNTAPPDAAVQYLANGITLQGKSTPFPMFEALMASGACGSTWIGSSFGDQVSENKIDYIFARKSPQACVRNGRVITDTYDDGYSVSDHAVVMAEFCLGEDCTSCRVPPEQGVTCTA